MVMDRATPRGKNVGDFFVALSLTHPMKNLAFSRCQPYLDRNHHTLRNGVRLTLALEPLLSTAASQRQTP
jgi:hypothetical protein